MVEQPAFNVPHLPDKASQTFRDKPQVRPDLFMVVMADAGENPKPEKPAGKAEVGGQKRGDLKLRRVDDPAPKLTPSQKVWLGSLVEPGDVFPLRPRGLQPNRALDFLPLEPLEVAPEKAVPPIEQAKKEIDETLNRFPPLNPVEPGATELASKIARSALQGDIKMLQGILAEHKGAAVLVDAVELASDALEDTGLYLHWSSEDQSLTLKRYPSVWLNGPKGMALKISGKGGAEAYDVVHRPRDAKPDLNAGPFVLKASQMKPDVVAAEIGKTAIDSLAARQKNLHKAIEAVRLAGALNHAEGVELAAPGFKTIHPGQDKVTPLAVALLEKRLSPMLRAVQAAKSEDELHSLAEKLNMRLNEIDMHASYSEDEGFCIYTHSNGGVDGYSLSFPTKRGEAIQAFELRGPKHSNPDKHLPLVHRVFEGEDMHEISINEAMRGFYRHLTPVGDFK